MSTRANVASVVASLGVLGAGWQAGAPHLLAVETVGAAQPQPAASGTATSPPTGTRTTQPAQPVPQQLPPGGRGPGEQSAAQTVSLTVPAGASGTFTGRTATHRFGTVTVTVTLASGRITQLTERVVDDGDRHSTRINEQAVPLLREEILAASGGGDVATISGATYTTAAYLTSLQSALDQAR